MNIMSDPYTYIVGGIIFTLDKNVIDILCIDGESFICPYTRKQIFVSECEKNTELSTSISEWRGSK